MPIHTNQTQAHHFHGLKALDDVFLYIEHSKASCRFTFVCYSNAWTAHFNDLDAHESPIDRLLAVPADEMARALQWGTPEILNRDRAKERIYLQHIITAVKTELAAYIDLQGQ